MKKAKKDARQLNNYNKAKTFQMQERDRIRCKPFDNDVYNGKDARDLIQHIFLSHYRRVSEINNELLSCNL